MNKMMVGLPGGTVKSMSLVGRPGWGVSLSQSGGSRSHYEGKQMTPPRFVMLLHNEAGEYVACVRGAHYWSTSQPWRRQLCGHANEALRAVGEVAVATEGTWDSFTYIHTVYVLPEYRGHGYGLYALMACQEIFGPLDIQVGLAGWVGETGTGFAWGEERMVPTLLPKEIKKGRARTRRLLRRAGYDKFANNVYVRFTKEALARLAAQEATT